LPDGKGGYRDGDELERESQQATAEIMRNPFASSTPYTLQQDQGTLLRSTILWLYLSLSLWSGSLSLTHDVRVWVWHGTHDRKPVLRHVAATAVASPGLLLVLHLL
jgi:hypothetical protein